MRDHDNTILLLGKFKEAKKYWLETLSGELTPTGFPTDFSRTAGYQPGTCNIPLDGDRRLWERLAKISRGQDLSLYVVLLAAFHVLLFRYTQKKDIFIASPVYSGNEKSFNDCIVFKDFIDSPMTFAEVLVKLKKTVSEAYKNQHFPLKKAFELLEIKEGDHSLFRTMLLLKNIHKQESVTPLIHSPANDLAVSFLRTSTGLEGEIIYNAQLFREETISRISRLYLQVLKGALADIKGKIQDLELMTEEERHRLLYEFNDTRTDFPAHKTLHQLFEEQVERTPDRSALRCGIDLSDVYEILKPEADSSTFDARLLEKMEKCCFKKNPYIYQHHLDLPTIPPHFKILKTHRHNSMIVDSNVPQLLNLFDGSKNTTAILARLKDIHLKLRFYAMAVEDVLEISYDFAKETEMVLNGNLEDFTRLIKALYNNYLIELVDFRSGEAVEKEPMKKPLAFQEVPSLKISPAEILRLDRKLSKAQVLLLGDTTGMPTSGLLYLASYLRRNGITAYCQFYNADRDPASLKKDIRFLLEEIQPEVVAVSMKWFLHIARVREICKLVKEVSPGIKVVIGGNTASYYAGEIIEYEHIDYLVRGDGELPLLRICRGEPDIPNCIYKKDGKIIDNPVTYIEDKTNTSETYLSHLDEILLSRYAPLFGSFFIYTHKGCSMNCLYCGGCRDAHKKKFNRTGLFRRGVAEARKDIIEAKKYTSTYMFDFDAPNKDLTEYCRQVWEGIDLSSHFAICGNLVPPSPELIELAQRTFKYVYWTLDIASLSQRHRQHLFSLGVVKPQPSDAEIFTFFDRCEAYDNAEIRINLIAGLPHFTDEDLEESERVLDRLTTKYSCASELHWARLHAQPGAPIVADAGTYDMHSYATTYKDFLKYSETNFLNPSGYPGVEDFNYPYIYYNDDRLNANVTRHYHEMNAKVTRYLEDKRKQLMVTEDLTYTELNQRANRLAGELRKRGVGRGIITGIMVDRSVEMTVGVLGILKAGGAYLPIDSETPKDRVLTMLVDAQARLLLTKSGIFAAHEWGALMNRHLDEAAVYRTAARPPILDFDGLPLPDRSLVDYEKYSRYVGLGLVKNSITLQATRGCPYHCLYCHKIWGKRHIVRSAENIFDEVQLFYRMGVRRFIFIDDVFNLDIKNSKRFFELIIKNGLDVQLFFPNGMRGDILTKEYIDLMVKAGTVEVALALETASPRLQKLIKKNVRLEKLRENIEYFCQTYPQVILEIFMMYGFPTETEAEATMTLDFIKSLKWVHFPLFSILKIYPDTDMASLAVEKGVSMEAIKRSENLSYHEVPETIPFDKVFTLKHQADFLNEYFLSKERLLHVLPYQMKVLTEEELVRKYNNHLPGNINNFSDLLELVGISEEELGEARFRREDDFVVPHLNRKIRDHFPLPAGQKNPDALKVLLLDLSQYFSREGSAHFDVYEPPLGLVSLMTYLNREFGSRVKGRVAKSRIDFDNFNQLKALLEEFQPDIIGIRTLTYYKDFFRRVTTLIRRWGFAGPVISGGPHATSNFAEVLSEGHVDLVVMGEGELTFAQLIGCILGNEGKWPNDEDLKEIPGIAFVPGKRKSQSLADREVLMLDDPGSLSGSEPAGNLPHINSPGDLAYIIFTSGTTGKPKGAAVAHRGVVNYTWWRLESYDYTENDVTLQLISFSFDGFASNFYSGLLSGGGLVMIPDKKKTDFQYIKELVKRLGITNMSVVPGMYEALLFSAESEELQGLRFVVLAGEKAPEQLVAMSKERLPNLLLINEYGPTETTVTAAALLGMRTTDVSIIGKPIANTHIYILDSFLKPVPLSVAGEIYIAGVGVAKGYLNRPRFTAEKFLESPFPAGEKLYKTGDLGRWLPTGHIQILGREDNQITLRGFRIELGEIETCLGRFRGIKSAAVIVREEESGNKFLCAYFVSDEHIDLLELKAFLIGHLPEYMVPTFLMQIDEMPLTITGKVDRKALVSFRDQDTETYIAPRDDVEETLAAIWANVLGLKKDTVGIDANFFELGGHSLKVTLMISEIQKELNVKVQMAKIFELPTIRGLGEFIKTAAAQDHVSVETVEEREYYPLSSAQKRLYFLQQMELDSIVYNTPSLVVLEETIDLEKMESIFRRLINRHESLRTSFITAAEEPVQKIHDKVKFSIEHYNTKVFKQIIRPFDLSQAPLLRVGVIRESEKRHILIVDMHHIISDGFSMNILMDEFSTLYAGGKLPALGVQYRDYVLWQGSREQQAAVKRQEAFWVREFSGETPVLDLPIDFPRPPMQSFEGDTVEFWLGREETLALNQWAKDRDATLFMVLLAVYNILLSKLSGQEDIIVGTPIVGRRHADFQQVIGMFVNTLVLRNFPGPGKTFDRFLQEIKERTLEAFENQEYPFEELVEKVDVRRDAARNPLFDVMFSFQNLAEQTGNRPDTDTGGDENRISKFDLTLNAVEAGERLHFGFEYAVKLFKKETIERFADYFKRIVFSIVQHPERKIAEIGIISKEEKTRILEEFNNTTAPYPKEKTLVQVFEEQVKKTPDNAAVTIPGASITYGQLDRMSNRLAHLLREKGVGPDTIVALMVERSVEMMVGIFGILKAGGAYLPIDPNYPAERINYILSDSNTVLLLTTREVSEGLASDKEMVYLEDYKEIKEGIHHSSFFAHHSENLAYVIYTSGSTGKPKGTMIQHYSVINRLNWMQRYYPLDERDVILQKTTYVFDVSVWELFWWSFNGASLRLLGPGEEKDPAAIVEAVEESKVTTMHFVPSMLTAFLDYVEETGESERLTSLRQVFASGEALAMSQVERFNKLLSKNGTRLINLYGPTEATVDVSYFNCPTEGVVEKVPIGKPIDNTQLYVLGETGQLQPVGIAGELCIAGDQLARGYLNRPELTAEKFNRSYRTNRTYKTGDLTRWLDDGNIEFLGRIDYQVKIRGFRIELGEIEAQLRKEKEIKEVVVIDRTDNTGSKYLCAYIVPAAEIHLPVLRDRLSSCLPEYMVPAHFMTLDKIPLTTNGKLDRKALPLPEIIAEAAYEAPRDDVEKTLQNIWAEVLNVETEQLGIDANFFRVGGHSLKATTLVSRIHKELDVKVPLAEIFKKPTIRGFAQYIKEAAENKYASITPAEPRAYYPLSSAQKRLYILQQIEKESIGYNMPQVIRLSLDIDRQKIAHILETLIQRHEILRTSFEMQDGKPVQKVHAAVPFQLAYYKADEEESGKIIAGFVTPFDLASAPLLRVGMIKTGEMEHIFMMDMHHIITDGVSQEIFIREFMALYSGEELPPLRLQYKDYSEWQNSAEFKAMIKQQEAYWLKEYAGEIPLLDLPADFSRPVVQSFDGRFEQFFLESQETAKLKQLARQLDGTLYMVLLALFNVFLSKLGRNEDVIVGTPVAARRHADLEQVLGMFVNTLALRNFPSGEKTFKAFVAEVKERALQAFENQEYQFEDLVEKVVYRRDTSRNPLFDVFFVLQTQAETTQQDLESRLAEEVESRISKFDLTLNAVEAGERLHLGFEYVSKLFKKETIERFINYFKRILSFVIDHPEKKIADIEIISGEEKKRILEEFNNTDAPYPAEKTLCQVFEEQAAQTPDSIALVGPASITYKQLNHLTDQLAGLLRSKGVGPDTIAALMVERSIEMMIGIFGILKAGGAYLPIDPHYPEERINYILSDSNAGVLLSKVSEVSEVSGDIEVIDLNNVIDKNMDPNARQNPPTHLTHPTHLSYVIYTSGSTGKPKGTMIQHYSVINRLNWMQRYYPLEKRDVILQKTTYTFDVSVWELFWWSFSGASLRLLGPGEEKDPGAIVKAVEESNVTTMHFVPSMLTAFLDYVENTGENERLASLRQVFASGEALGVGQVERFNKLLSKNGTRLINLYGPTEATVDVSYFNCPTEGVVEKVPIGKPIDNTQLYVLGEAGQLQPVGIAGELCIAGHQLARGYLNRPQLTAEKFCLWRPGAHFEKTAPGPRKNSLLETYSPTHLLTHSPTYKTGDLARWLDDGNIEFLGRIDHQVKIRGFRIEPGEIESHLMAHEEIKTVVVVVLQRQSDPNKQALCAYFTAQKQLDVPGLRGYLTGKVPAYMIPAYFMQVEEIPLTANGKLDRRRLPSPEIKTGSEYIAPKSHTEKTIAETWKEILGLEKVGTLDNFFEIGGNSLDIIQVNSQLNESLNKNIPVVTMFRYPTIRSLVDYLENENIGGTISDEKIDQSRDKMEKTIGIMRKMRQNES